MAAGPFGWTLVPMAAEAPTLDSLAAHWLASLEAANSALAADAEFLGRVEAAQRAAELGQERTRTLHLLDDLEHELHAHSRLTPWLARNGADPQMLGLPRGVRACVFDLDGVLATSAEAHAAAWADVLDPFLLEQAELHHRPYVPFDRRHEYRALLAGRARLDGVRAFLESRGLHGDVQALAARKNELLRLRLARVGVQAFEGSRGYLEAAHVAHLGRAVVSPSANTALFLHRAGLDGLVDAVVDGNSIDAGALRPKPAPDTVLAACELLRVEPGRAAAFETTPDGVAAARAAGLCFVVGVDRDGEETLQADRVVGDLTELLI
jgi:beta-phosphoglucomutase-like phosphatase (HAD superfamily)